MIKFLLAILLTLAPCFGQGMILNPYRFAASGPFTPSSISGLAVWLDASDTTTTFQDTALTTAASTDGTSVAAIKNKVGGGSTNAVQSTSTKRPVLKTSLYNSKNCLRFDGTDDTLQIANLPLPTFISVFVVGKFTTTSGYMFIEHGSSAVSSPGFVFFGHANPMWGENRSSVFNYAVGTAEWMTANLGQVDFLYDATGGVVKKNGTTISNGTINGSTRSDSYTTTALNVMSRNQASLFSNGDLCELLIYVGKLTDTDAQSVRDYLKSKWGTP